MPNDAGNYRNRLLAPIALVVVLAALKVSYPVAMPVLFAAMILAASWPLKCHFDRWLPSWLSYTFTIATLVTLLGGFAAAVYISLGQVWSVISGQWDQVNSGYQVIAKQAGALGIPLDSALEQRRAANIATALAGKLYSFVTYLGLIAILVILGLPEVKYVRERLSDELGRKARMELVDILSTSARQIRSYLATTFLTSAITGIASLVFSLAVGLDLALVWGLLNFLLNFVPVVGNIIGIIPPVLYAIIQFDGYWMPIIVFVGFAALQLVISNFLYPYLQGRQLSISPVAIIVSMAFWSWMWGIAGALIAVPLTACLTIICRHFERTQWIAGLVSREPN